MKKGEYMHTIFNALQQYATEKRKQTNMRFFKTGKGEYGEGDQFLGVSVPDCRKVARTFLDSPLSTIEKSLESPLHEERLTALLVLVEKFKKAKKEKEQKEIVDFYLAHVHGVNNWDLVDLSADKILGSYLLEKETKTLHDFVSSPNVWKRRIAVISTFAFIRKMRFQDTFQLTEKLLSDKHDLMHKACGWMLREIGKRDEKALEKFLEKYAQRMPRTMLRYAIECFLPNKRKAYLEKGKKGR